MNWRRQLSGWQSLDDKTGVAVGSAPGVVRTAIEEVVRADERLLPVCSAGLPRLTLEETVAELVGAVFDEAAAVTVEFMANDAEV